MNTEMYYLCVLIDQIKNKKMNKGYVFAKGHQQ